MRVQLLRGLAIAALVAGALVAFGRGGDVAQAQYGTGPANDNFADAAVIDPGVSSFTDTVDISDASTESGEPQYCAYSPKTVWYAVTPTSSETIRLDPSGSGFYDTELNVYRQDGSGFGGLSFMGCGSFGSPVSFQAQAGATYYVQAGNIYGGLGSLQLNLQVVPPPPNDDFANATAIGQLPFSDGLDTTAATNEPGEPSASCFGSGNTVWYSFTPRQSGSYTAGNPYGGLAVYTGSSLGSLTEVGCRTYGQLTFHADAGVTYRFQVGYYYGGFQQLNLSVALPPTANFSFYPGSPSVLDTVQFYDYSYDPGGNPFSTERWSFGDGTTATNPGYYVQHRYSKDGDYTVRLDVTTTDGRTAFTTQVVHVQTHNVSITKLTVPQSASVGQTRQISVGVASVYPETVQVVLEKSVVGWPYWKTVGTLTQSIPGRSANRTTPFDFTYTFTSDDAVLGRVTFRATAYDQTSFDVNPGDNQVISLPTKVSH